MNSPTNRLTGAAVMRRVLERFGVKTVFALAGASQTLLLDECEKADFRIVPSRHESATVGAADGYSRVTGKVGIAMVNVDQGMPNAITGLQQAFEACSPVVVLVGREPDSWTQPELDFDHGILGLVQPVTKWARTVQSAARLGEYLEAACRRALAGRPGPVVLAVPKDFLKELVDPGVDLDTPVAPNPRPAPVAEDVVRATDLLQAAKRPLIIAGSGAFRSGAGAVLRNFTDLGIPVATHNLGRGLVPENDHTGWGWPLAQFAAHEADLVIWAGARMAKKFGYGLSPRFPPSVKMIQIDLEAEEIGRNRMVEVGLVADSRTALEAILNELKTRAANPYDPSWVKHSLQKRLDAIEQSGHEEDHIHPLRLARAVNARLPKDAIFIQDGASILVRSWAVTRYTSDGGYMDTMPLGSMGMGTPLALGAVAGAKEVATETGKPERPVVMVTGDGAFGFYCAELDSAAKADLPFLCVISNNGGWGNEIHTQPHQVGRTINAHFADTRYDTVAQGFGAAGFRVEAVGELESTLDKAFIINDKAVVVDVIVQESGGLDPLTSTLLYHDVEQTRAKHFGGGTPS
ncbi:MAG: thiamine pyrophosphate-binding protein [Rhodospirillaceae bacterium]|nr:thiamine pyrophosphate-binding protein [Rhodospirillaceae bacterium]MBT7451183.1 thiamine pyrophosphate-binding protein [Rhodospirillaceae bacterium]